MAFLTTTSLNSFTANTKAKASEVNSNFQTVFNSFNTVTTQALIGSLWENYVSTAAGYSLTSADAFKGLLINVNTSTGYGVELPTASGNAFLPFYIKNIGLTTGAISLTVRGGGNVEGTSTISLVSGDVLGVVSDNSQWRAFSFGNLATANIRGLVGTGNQTFSGTKTFSGGNFRFAADTGGLGNSSNPYATPSDDIDTGFYFPTSNAMGLAAGGNGAIYIDSAGFVAIGATVPSSPLKVESSHTDFTAVIKSNDATNARACSIEAPNASGSHAVFQVSAAGGNSFLIRGNAQVDVDTTNWGTGGTAVGVSGVKLTLSPSSQKFKKNIEDLKQSGLIDTSKIYDIETKVFEYIIDGKQSFGAIAEDVFNILPCIVHCEEDEEKNKIPISISESKIVWLILEEMRKLKSRIESLEAIVSH